MKLKEFEIWISEETTFKYKIKAKNLDEANEFAIDNHDEGIKANRIDESVDRFEIIYSKELENEKNK